MDVSSGTTFDECFECCHHLEVIDVSSWDLSNAHDFYGMFYHCYSARSIILPETVTVKDGYDYYSTYDMFYETESVEEINLRGFVFPEGVDINTSEMFYDSSVRVLHLPDNFPVVSNMELNNKNDNYLGWIKAGPEESGIISGDGNYAEFDLGAGTYYHVRETVKTEGTPATCEEDGVQDCYKLANPMPVDPGQFPDGVIPEDYVPEADKLFYDQYAVYEVEDVNEDGVVDEKDLVIPATDHDWGEWEVVTEPTTETEGLRRRVCKNDPSHVEEEVIPKLDPEESASESETESETESAADSSKADSSSKAAASEATKTASTTTTTNPGTGAATAAFGLTAALAAAVVVTKKRNK